MDFTPRAPLRVAVLAHLPFTCSIDLQTGAALLHKSSEIR
ncbi:MAG: hypothetical protein E5299_02145 [Burkholderia gladioli]|nr:MAG: hypothetical protein E5299_02145 [Burkholderia gladioli]